MPKVFRVWIVPTALALLVLGCGGSASTGPSAEASGSAPPAGVVEVSGGQTGTISAPGGCGEDMEDASSWNGTFQTDELDWMLDVTLEKTLEPGRYPIGDHEAGKATIMMYAGDGGPSYDGVPGAGVVDVETGTDHGSIDAELKNAADGTTVKVVGEWTCES